MNTTIPVAFSGFTGKATMPFYLGAIQAGYPMPVSGYLNTEVDFNEMLATHRNSTFMVQVSGDTCILTAPPVGCQ